MERFKVRINSSYANTIKKNPFFFLKFHERNQDDFFSGKKYEKAGWTPIDENYTILKAPFIPLNETRYRYNRYSLCIIEKEEDDATNNDSLCYYAHDVSLQNEDDLQQVLKTYTNIKQLEDSNNKYKKYAFVELLWLLNYQHFDEITLKKAIAQNDENNIKFICSGLASFGTSLSVKKQRVLKRVIESFGIHFDIYERPWIQDALDKIGENWQYNESDQNIFDVIDLILEKDIPTPIEVDGNKLLELKMWFDSEKPFSDYSYLVNLFSLVHYDFRMKIIKRWFHDIRLGNTEFDSKLLSQFKDNKFDNFIRFRYGIRTPHEPILLTDALLADTILTIYNTKGHEFQTIDGLLDFVTTHCDTSHPIIDFRMERFIPKCYGGVLYNKNFLGFIDYSIVRKLDETKLNDEFVLTIMKQILDRHAQRKSYEACKWNENVPLSEGQCQNCPHNKVTHDEVEGTVCHVSRQFEDKWLVRKCHDFDFNEMLKEPIEFTFDSQKEVDLSMLSTEKFINYIKNLPNVFEEHSSETFVEPSSYRDNTIFQTIFEKFSIPLKMRIIPNHYIDAGYMIDENHIGCKNSTEIYRHIIESLETNYSLGEFNYSKGYFEIEYDQDLLSTIKKEYYFKKSEEEAKPGFEYSFLVHYKKDRYKRPFCAPKMAAGKNDILNLPFFWCNGKQCFYNNLGTQTVNKTGNWKYYTLYHLIEIIGYPKIHENGSANVADESILRFIAVANKVEQKFNHLKCRSCGHLLFASNAIEGFGRKNHYVCKNPSCSEYNHSVYLNHCFKCGKSLIDSRDTKLCPNGWYICPECLSCCNDEQYEKQAQRYVVTRKPIPKRIQEKLGKGHNDKNIYFCPKCGVQLESFLDDHGDLHYGCPQCRERYDHILKY